jgi:RNA polymerase sigma-54 factor
LPARRAGTKTLRLGLHQTARQELRLVQSPQMIQAMQILQLPALDLEERIEQELVENPFLEEVEARPDAKEEPADERGLENQPKGLETMLEELERAERDFGDGGRMRVGDREEGDRKLEAMANTPDAPKSLAEALIEELAMIDFDRRGRRIAEYLVYSLDERAYLKEPLEDIARQCTLPGEPPVTVEELENVLFELRQIVHPALGAQDLRECLLLQIDALQVDSPLLRTLVVHHLEDIEANRLPRIAKATGRSLDEIKEAVDSLRHLEPTPGLQYGEALAQVITPDVIVEEVDGDYEVRLERQRIPELTVSKSYREILRQAKKEDKVREWVQKRVESARWFIDAVHQRQNTLQRIADAIFRHQRDFLDKGISALHPLRMQEVADEVKVHISTVSRAVSGKYAQTPRGIFPLKFFFTGGTAKSTGEVASQVSIKQRIADLVAAEDTSSPLSDEELAAKLAEKDNISIARRTVTKYRKALSIPTSSQRKKF